MMLTTETTPANPEIVMGERWKQLVNANGIPKWFETMLSRHMTGDCGDAWPDEDWVLDQLQRNLHGYAFESRWKTPMGLLVVCSFCSGHYVGLEIMPYS